MVRTNTALRLPLWVLLVGALLLVAVVAQPRTVLAPAPAHLPASSTVQGQASTPAADSTAGSSAISQRTIPVSTPAAEPPAAPPTGQQQPPPPSSAQCPAEPGSGLPCRVP